LPSRSSRRLNADESRLVEDWARFGNPDELRRICKDILNRRRQGYAVAFEAWHIIRAHADHWHLDAPVELDSSRKNRALLKLIHDMRRSAVRKFERSGVPRSAAMAMVGHKTESIYRRYAIVDEAMLREAAARLDAWVQAPQHSRSGVVKPMKGARRQRV